MVECLSIVKTLLDNEALYAQKHNVSRYVLEFASEFNEFVSKLDEITERFSEAASNSLFSNYTPIKNEILDLQRQIIDSP